MNETFNSKWYGYPKENRDSIAFKLLFYLIWPFGAWLYCLKQPQYKSSYILFFLFSLLLCWHMAPRTNVGYDDFIGIKERFEVSSITTSDLIYEIQAYFSMADDGPKELYEDIVIWFVKGLLVTIIFTFYWQQCQLLFVN